MHEQRVGAANPPTSENAKTDGFTPLQSRYPLALEVQMAKKEKERHPFRFLFKFLIFVGIMALIGRLLSKQKDEFYGITESEARLKFESKLGPRIGDDKAAEVADQVIPKLKEKGVIKPDPVDETVETVVDVTDEAADEAVEAAEEVLEEVSD